MIELIWAQDEFLAAELVDTFTGRAGDGDEVIALTCEASVPGLEEALFASSLFAKKRYVVLWKAEQLRKDGIERLSAALHTPDLDADVAIVATSEYQPTQLAKAVQDVAKLHKLQRPRRGQLVAWVASRMTQANLVPDREAAGSLVEAVGEGLRELAGAIDQLALRLGPKAKVGRAQVLEQFSLIGDQPIWVLFDAIVRHEGPKAFDILRRVIRQGDEPLAVLFAIVSQVRYLIRAKSLLEREPMDESQLARALGVSAGRAAVLRRQAARLSWEWLIATHRLLSTADYELKGGEEGAVLPADVVLERVVAGALEAE